MAKKTKASAEYLKIRRYVLLLARQSGASATLLPSNAELAEKFGVSRPTVSKAMQSLVREGFIVGKRGVGSFANPLRSISWKLKNVGILYGDGMYVWYDSFSAKYYGSLFLECSELNGAVIQPLTLNSGSLVELTDELQFQKLDALVCVNPHDDAIRTLRKFPDLMRRTLLVDAEAAGFSSVSMDFDRLGMALGDALIADGCRNPVYLFNKPPWNRSLNGFVRAFDKAGFPVDRKRFLGVDEVHIADALQKLHAAGDAVDSLFMPVARPDQLEEILKTIPLAPDRIRLVFCRLNSQTLPGFRGYFYEFPFLETVRLVRNQLETILRDGGMEPEQKFVPISFSHIS